MERAAGTGTLVYTDNRLAGTWLVAQLILRIIRIPCVPILETLAGIPYAIHMLHVKIRAVPGW